MTAVSLSVRLFSDELKGLDLPVEVRDDSMRLVREAVAGETLELKEGIYLMSARLPAGQPLTKIVEVKGDKMHCQLEPDMDKSQSEWRESSHYFQSAKASQSAKLAVVSAITAGILKRVGELGTSGGQNFSLRGFNLGMAQADFPGDLLGRFSTNPPAPKSPPAKLRIFSGNPLSGTTREESPSIHRVNSAADAVRLHVSPAKISQILQLQHVGRPAINICLPVSKRSGATIVIYRKPERYWVEVLPESDLTTRLLVGYRENHVTRAQQFLSEVVSHSKVDDPIAAAARGYVLLQFGDLDRDGGWIRNIFDEFPELPDGAAILGEYLARTGQHVAAIEAFRQTRERGLPMFSDGIRFLFNRLKIYVEANAGLSSSALVQAGELRDQWRPYFGACDFGRTLTTFAGSNPTNPDASRSETVSELASTGLEIGDFFPD